MSAAKLKIKDLEDHIRRKNKKNFQNLMEEKGLKDLSTPVVYEFDYGTL